MDAAGAPDDATPQALRASSRYRPARTVLPLVNQNAPRAFYGTWVAVAG
jgi:hypothetical protein